jgi:hypothetical protein
MSGERLLVVLVVRESEDMEEMEEDGVWVLCEGGSIENMSVLRSGSKGEFGWRRGRGVDVHRKRKGGEITLRWGRCQR